MRRFSVFLLFGIWSCIDPLDNDNPRNIGALVIEGMITSQPGPYTISVSRSAAYQDVTQSQIEFIENAIVTIRDSDDNNIICEHVRNGIYETPLEYQGSVGNTYTLLVRLEEKTYISNPMTLHPVVPVDSIFSVFTEIPETNESNGIRFKTGTDLFVAHSDRSNQFNLWTYDGTHYIKTFPERHTDIIFGREVPAPKSCCSDCWRTELTTNFSVSRVSSLTGTSKIFFIQDDGYRFLDKYHMEIQHHSLSEETFTYFRNLEQIISIDGDIFDPPPLSVGTNIWNINDPEDLVIGHFFATDIVQYTYEIRSSSLDYLQPLPEFPDDCLLFDNSINFPPDFW